MNLPIDSSPGIINQALMRIRVHENIIDKNMFLLLFTNMINQFSAVHSNGSAIKNIPPFSDLKPMNVLVPNIYEQTKIGQYFSQLDNLVTLHQRELEILKNLKKTCLKRMFI